MTGSTWTIRSAISPTRTLLAAGLVAVATVLGAVPSPAQSGADCAALRARIDERGGAGDTGQAASVVRQARAELDRVTSYAHESGCDGGSVFDDPDSPECHALLRHAEQLRQTVTHLSAGAGANGTDEDRRAAIEDYNASCAGNAESPTPDAVVPVDPDAPVGPGPVPADRVARVYCVRHCDGAYYPLAVDVPKSPFDNYWWLMRRMINPPIATWIMASETSILAS